MRDEQLIDIIKHHYYLQYGCFFSEVIDVRGALFSFNDVMECFIWNHVFPHSKEIHLKELLLDAECYFQTRLRKPCVYLDEYTNTQENVEFLCQAGYECVDNEAWMMFPLGKNTNRIVSTLKPIQISKHSDLKEFLSICSECFGEQYSIAIEREYNRFQVHKKVTHVVFYRNNVAVGIGSLYSFDKYIFIHNVGVKEQYRNSGYAKELMQYLIDEAYSIGIENPKLILQCDGGGFIEDMYLKLGFENIYRRWGYLKA